MACAFTVEDLVRKTGVRNIDQECTNEDFLALADLCDPWNLVGHYLKLTPSQLSAIDSDSRTTGLKRLALLQKWKESFAFKATYKVLVSALLSCGKTVQALEVCEVLARKQGGGMNGSSTQQQTGEIQPVQPTSPTPVATNEDTVSICKLDQRIDAENQSSKHLGQIADSMTEWQGTIADELELTRPDVEAIMTKHPTKLRLQAREALEIWKQRKGLNATYRNLMDVFSRAGYQTCADRIQEICMNTVCKCLGVTSRFKSQKGMAFVFIVNDIWTAYISDPFTPGSASLTGCSSSVASPSSQASPPRSGSLPSDQQAASCTHSPSQTQVKLKCLQLIKWKDEQGITHKFYLMESIQNKWRDIGQLVDIPHAQLEAFLTEHREKPIECCRAVLGIWLDNPPEEYPATWDGLIELLEDCKLSSVVKDLKNALSKAVNLP